MISCFMNECCQYLKKNKYPKGYSIDSLTSAVELRFAAEDVLKKTTHEQHEPESAILATLLSMYPFIHCFVFQC